MTCLSQTTSLLFAAAMLVAAPAAADAAVYTGTFDEGYMRGTFSGVDRDGDARISQTELTGFSAIMNNMNGGSGQFAVESSVVSDFLLVDLGGGRARLTATVSFWFQESLCGGWAQPPCEYYGYGVAAFAGPMSFSYEVLQPLNTNNVSFNIATAAVPLPAGGFLMAGGLAALGAFAARRRRKA